MTKKLTAKSIRQGQTVYHTYTRYDLILVKCVPLISVIDASYARSILTLHKCATYSRRKATSKAKELNRMMGVM